MYNKLYLSSIFCNISVLFTRGHFAVVKKCTCKKTNIDRAAKFITVKKSRVSQRGASRDTIEREVKILKLIDSEKIMKLYDVFDLGNEIVLVMEL